MPARHLIALLAVVIAAAGLTIWAASSFPLAGALALPLLLLLSLIARHLSHRPNAKGRRRDHRAPR